VYSGSRFSKCIGKSKRQDGIIVAYPRSITKITYHIIHTPIPVVLGVRRCIGKDPSLRLVRSTSWKEYITVGGSSPYKLFCRVELAPKFKCYVRMWQEIGNS